MLFQRKPICNLVSEIASAMAWKGASFIASRGYGLKVWKRSIAPLGPEEWQILTDEGILRGGRVWYTNLPKGAIAGYD